MRLTSDNVVDFHASVSTAPLGPLQMVRSRGNAHDTIRNRRDVERTETRFYHLMVSVSDPWTFTHRGQKRLLQGDLVLSDSQFEHEINIRSDFDILNLKMPVPWLRTWVPDPDALVGRHIAKSSSWGQVLSPVLSQLLPEFIVDSPLRPELLTEHIGAMLALVAGEYADNTRTDRDLLRRIEESILQRCAEPGLTAAEIAASLAISPRALHKTLAQSGQTFAARLLAARLEIAIQMLRSPASRNLAISEVTTKSGLLQVADLNRVIRKRLGLSAANLRAGRQT
jgi:AraC-like DNA-binding protein